MATSVPFSPFGPSSFKEGFNPPSSIPFFPTKATLLPERNKSQKRQAFKALRVKGLIKREERHRRSASRCRGTPLASPQEEALGSSSAPLGTESWMNPSPGVDWLTRPETTSFWDGRSVADATPRRAVVSLRSCRSTDLLPLCCASCSLNASKNSFPPEIVPSRKCLFTTDRAHGRRLTHMCIACTHTHTH